MNKQSEQNRKTVRRKGNRPAQQLIREVFRVIARKCPGVGEIPQSRLGLSEAYVAFDAEREFGVVELRVEESFECLSDPVLQVKINAHECPAFGTRCTAEQPLGATMVSSECSRAACHRYLPLSAPTQRAAS